MGRALSIHLPPATADKAAKLIRLLGSDKPNEVLGSVGALRRVLEGAGADLHALARLVEAAPSLPLATPDEDTSDGDWMDLAYYCLQNGGNVVTERQRAFLENLIDKSSYEGWPTEKQVTWLKAIVEKVRAAHG